MKQTNPNPAMGGKRRGLWTLLFLLIAAATIWTVASQNKHFSVARFMDYVAGSNPWWLAAGVVSMLLYIGFGAASILCILREFGYRRSPLQGLSYTAADLYFSAITPSATGGQPAAGYFMMKDGVSGIVSTVTLLANLALYTVSIVIIGLVCLALRPGTFLRFSTLSRVMILIGCAVQLGLTTLYMTLLWKKELMRKLVDWALRVLTKLRLLRNPQRRRERLMESMDRYDRCTAMLKGKSKMLAKALVLNILHRSCQIAVTVFCYLAQHGQGRHALDLFAMQSEVVVGANFIPIPGAMGVTDYLMLDVFSSLMTPDQAANLELLARTTSFYFCIIICGVIVLCKSALLRLRREKK